MSYYIPLKKRKHFTKFNDTKLKLEKGKEKSGPYFTLTRNFYLKVLLKIQTTPLSNHRTSVKGGGDFLKPLALLPNSEMKLLLDTRYVLTIQLLSQLRHCSPRVQAQLGNIVSPCEKEGRREEDRGRGSKESRKLNY